MNLLSIVEGRHTWIHQLSENWQTSRLMVSIICAFWGDLCQHPVSNCHPMCTTAPEIIMTPAELAVSCCSIFVRWINHSSDISMTWKNLGLKRIFRRENTLNRHYSPFSDTGATGRDQCRSTCENVWEHSLHWKSICTVVSTESRTIQWLCGFYLLVLEM